MFHVPWLDVIAIAMRASAPSTPVSIRQRGSRDMI